MKFPMKTLLTSTVLMACGMTLTACDDSETSDELDNQADNAAERVEKNLGEARDAVDTYLSTTKQKVSNIDDDLAALKPKIDNVPEQVRTNINQNMAELERLRSDLNAKLEQINDSDVADWPELKAEANDLMAEIQSKYDSIKSMLEDELGEINLDNS